MKNPCNTHFYITDAGYEGVRNFKYKGGSSSVLYSYLWSPLCDWITNNMIPDTLAPNTITAFASLQYIATHIAMMYYSPDFQSPIPTYLLVWAGFSTLAYQILDNCDGKQARRTGSSSPLGMLFDHGCDSVITWIMAMNIFNAVGLGQNALSYFSLVIMSQISFYMAQWNQYHVGVFQLSYINAVDEGLVLVEGTFLLTAIMGQQWWQTPIAALGGMKYNQLMICLSLLGAIMQILQFFYDTLSQINNSEIWKTLGSAVWLFVAYTLVYLFSSDQFIASYGLYVHYGFACLFSKVTLQIQLAHLTLEEFNQWTFSFVFTTLFLVISFAINFFLSITILISMEILLFISIVMGVLAELHMAVCISCHISEILGIKVFSIVKKQNNFKPFSQELSGSNNSQLQILRQDF